MRRDQMKRGKRKGLQALPRRCHARLTDEPITLRRVALRPGLRNERPHPLRAYGRG